MSTMTKKELDEALRYAGSEAPRKERQKRLGQIEAHIAAQTEQLAARPVLWECPDCGFAFDAGHEDEPDGGHSCPCCAERRLTEQLENAEAVVAKLPKTADGVPVVPGEDTVWLCGFIGGVGGVVPLSYAEEYVISPFDLGPECEMHYVLAEDVSCCYSTREAAEAAKGERHGQDD